MWNPEPDSEMKLWLRRILPFPNVREGLQTWQSYGHLSCASLNSNVFTSNNEGCCIHFRKWDKKVKGFPAMWELMCLVCSYTILLKQWYPLSTSHEMLSSKALLFSLSSLSHTYLPGWMCTCISTVTISKSPLTQITCKTLTISAFMIPCMKPMKLNGSPLP